MGNRMSLEEGAEGGPCGRVMSVEARELTEMGNSVGGH